MTTIHFEDLTEGAVRDLGHAEADREEMLAFARRYDPQPIHTDETAAEDSIYGELIASGWYTAGLCMRLLVDGFFADAASMGSPGLEELRWTAPVRPGDTIHAENEIIETRPSESRSDRGYARNELRGYDDDGDLVIEWTARNIFLRREA